MKKIGKYDLLCPLGSGATSTVYLGRDPSTRRDVAIKIAFPEILRNPERSRPYFHLFKNEASLAGKLAHPHIVQIHDAVVTNEQCYIVMDYVRGGTLQECCTTKKLLPVGQVVEIVFKCTRALDFAHHIGITHRDIKPANILYVGDAMDGHIKISDFGAAIVGQPECTLVSGIGSPAYMSPEQVRELTLDHRTDIYSLGVVMYQLLTGQLPFRAESNYEMAYQIIHAEAVPPSRLRENIPEALDAVIARAMSKKVEDRYPTWEEFARDLIWSFRKKHSRIERRSLSGRERFGMLRKLSFFADFSDDEIREVLRSSTWHIVSPGQVIARNGGAGDSFGIVTDGELSISGNGRIPDRLSIGDCFGEAMVIGPRAPARDTNIAALTEARVISIKSDALQHVSEACRQHFYGALLIALSRRLALTEERLTALWRSTSTGRYAAIPTQIIRTTVGSAHDPCRSVEKHIEIGFSAKAIAK
jgi:serine/threonine protein kinase